MNADHFLLTVGVVMTFLIIIGVALWVLDGVSWAFKAWVYMVVHNPRRWFQARFRLNDAAVCEMSRGMGLIDYHDYPDSEDGFPDHFTTLHCKRCRKPFTI